MWTLKSNPADVYDIICHALYMITISEKRCTIVMRDNEYYSSTFVEL